MYNHAFADSECYLSNLHIIGEPSPLRHIWKPMEKDSEVATRMNRLYQVRTFLEYIQGNILPRY